MKLVVHVATLIAMIQAWVMLIHKRAVCHDGKCVIFMVLLARDRERMANLNDIYNNNDIEDVNRLQMRRAPLAKLVETFWHRGFLEDIIHTIVEEHLAVFLHVVGHNERFEIIHNKFWRSSAQFPGISRKYCTGLGSSEQ
jgi:hypothetical protein